MSSVLFGITRNINKKEVLVTEETLLDNYEGQANGGEFVSVINGVNVIWEYVKGTSDSFGSIAPCERNEADFIKVLFDTLGVDAEQIHVMEKNDDNKNLEIINAEQERRWTRWK